MKDEITVVLAPNLDQAFRRSLRDPKTAQRLKDEPPLIFEKGEPVRVPAKFFDSIKRDIGNALLVCSEDGKGRWRHDYKATAKFKEFLDTGKLPAAPAAPKKASKPPATAAKKEKDKPADGTAKSD